MSANQEVLEREIIEEQAQSITAENNWSKIKLWFTTRENLIWLAKRIALSLMLGAFIAGVVLAPAAFGIAGAMALAHSLVSVPVMIEISSIVLATLFPFMDKLLGGLSRLFTWPTRALAEWANEKAFTFTEGSQPFRVRAAYFFANAFAFLFIPAAAFRTLATGIHITLSYVFFKTDSEETLSEDAQEQERLKKLFIVRAGLALFVRGRDVERELFVGIFDGSDRTHVLKMLILSLLRAAHYLTIWLAVEIIAPALFLVTLASPLHRLNETLFVEDEQIPDSQPKKGAYYLLDALSKLLSIPGALVMLIATTPEHVVQNSHQPHNTKSLITDVEKLRMTTFDDVLRELRKVWNESFGGYTSIPGETPSADQKESPFGKVISERNMKRLALGLTLGVIAIIIVCTPGVAFAGSTILAHVPWFLDIACIAGPMVFPFMSDAFSGLSRSLIAITQFWASGADNVRRIGNIPAEILATGLNFFTNVVALALFAPIAASRILATGIHIAVSYVINGKLDLSEGEQTESSQDELAWPYFFNQLFTVRLLRALFAGTEELPDGTSARFVEKIITLILKAAKGLHDYLTIRLLVDGFARFLLLPSWALYAAKTWCGEKEAKVASVIFDSLSKLIAIPGALLVLAATIPGQAMVFPDKDLDVKYLVDEVEKLRTETPWLDKLKAKYNEFFKKYSPVGSGNPPAETSAAPPAAPRAENRVLSSTLSVAGTAGPHWNGVDGLDPDALNQVLNGAPVEGGSEAKQQEPAQTAEALAAARSSTWADGLLFPAMSMRGDPTAEASAAIPGGPVYSSPTDVSGRRTPPPAAVVEPASEEVQPAPEASLR